jgi:hypothetical protein
MPPNPLLRLHAVAEAAGFPTLLIVTVICLFIVVSAVGLLALIPTTAFLVLAIVSLVAAVMLMGMEIAAALSDC